MSLDHAHERLRLLRLLDAIEVRDEIGRSHRDDAMTWVRSGAPLWRVTKPADPPQHLVSYLVPHDPATGRFLLVHHRNAGLLLPPGGHVEPGEDPWQTVLREAYEELRLTLDPATIDPTFVTVTETRGTGRHIDVSLWHLVEVAEHEVTWHDPGEFDGIVWLCAQQILDAPIDTMDPHLHRFIRDYRASMFPTQG